MAGGAGAGYGAVIHAGRGPCKIGMTILTTVGGCDVVDRLAGGCCAVVAGVTGAEYSVVIDPIHRTPTPDIVAIFAEIGGEDMCGRLACSRGAIVTLTAAAGHIGVVKRGRDPGTGCMTGVAAGGGGEVVGMFACGSGAVMATLTATIDVVVVHLSEGVPASGGVARLTNVGRADVTKRFLSCVAAVVTLGAVCDHTLMVVTPQFPGAGRVALVAIIVAGKVVDMFAGCADTVVTATAQADDCVMVNAADSAPAVAGVAIVTLIGARDMVYWFC